MHTLEAAARAAVENCTPENLHALRAALDAIASDRVAYREVYDRAEQKLDDDTGMDGPEQAFFSPSDEGVWVSAWLWVRTPQEDDDDDDA